MSFRIVPLATGVLLAAVPSTALAQSGGAAAPDTGGGHVVGQPSPEPAAPAPPRLRATIFTVSPGSVQLGQPLRFTWRVDGPVPTVRGRVALAPASGRAALPIGPGPQ